MIYTSKKIIIFLFTIMQLAILSSCMDSGYRLSFPEIDDLADEYPAQAKVFLSRADSNDNKGYYKLLTAKIEYQLKGYIYKENYIDDAINIFVNEKDEPLLARSLYYKGAFFAVAGGRWSVVGSGEGVRAAVRRWRVNGSFEWSVIRGQWSNAGEGVRAAVWRE